MSEFAHELSGRVSRTIESLREARTAGDDYLAEVRLGELESLGRLAKDHGLDLPQVADELAASGIPVELALPVPDATPTAPAPSPPATRPVNLDHASLRSA